MSESLPLEQAVWPYTPRNIDTVHHDVAVIRAGWESDAPSPLSEQDKATVDSFAAELVVIPGSDDSERALSLDRLSKTKVTEHQDDFYMGYFAERSAKGKLLALAGTAEPSKVTEWLYDVEGLQDLPDDEREKSEKARSVLAAKSSRWLSTQLTHAVIRDEDEIPFDVVRINTRPELVIEKLQGIRQFRKYYRELYAGLKNADETPLTTAQRELLTVHVSKVNTMAALTYPAAIALMEQFQHMPQTPQVALWREQLTEAAPFIGRAFTREHEDRLAHAQPGVVNADQQVYLDSWKDNVLSRLDYIRNGASIDDEGRIARVGSTVLRKMEDLATVDVVAPEPQLSPEIIAHMKRTKWSAAEMQSFNEAVLAEMDLLSDHASTADEIKMRKGRAPDGKVQVVLRNKSDSLEYDSAKGVLFVPHRMKRGLIDATPTGALAVTPHEIGHAVQDMVGRKVYGNLPLASIGGARNIMVKEMGGIDQERKFFGYVGKTRPTRATYPKGMLAKDDVVRSGGSAAGAVLSAAKAIVAEAHPDGKMTFKQARSKAALVQRFIRHGGHNSQPLDYIEQGILGDAITDLSTERRKVIALATGALSLRDTARLVKAGVITLPDTVDYDPAQSTLKVYLEQFYPDGTDGVH